MTIGSTTESRARKRSFPRRKQFLVQTSDERDDLGAAERIPAFEALFQQSDRIPNSLGERNVARLQHDDVRPYPWLQHFRRTLWREAQREELRVHDGQTLALPLLLAQGAPLSVEFFQFHHQ